MKMKILVAIIGGIALAPAAAFCGSVTIEPGAGWTPIAGVTSIRAGSALDFSELCGKREKAGAHGRAVAKSRFADCPIRMPSRLMSPAIRSRRPTSTRLCANRLSVG